MSDNDREANRFSARAARYARVGANVGGVAARMAGNRLMGRGSADATTAAALAQALGATAKDGAPLACKLQYPDMQSAVEADLRQLELAFALHRRMDPSIDTREIAKEIGERVREELDYAREAKHVALYARLLEDVPEVRVPAVWPDLSTRRLLTLGWLEGEKILAFKDALQEVRNRLAVAMFKAWWHPF